MTDINRIQKQLKMRSTEKSREHLANERTFLAWVRTSIGIMAFGFVVVKFSLFLKQLAFILQKNITLPQKGYSAILGILLVMFGLITSLLAYLQYRRVEKQLNNESFSPSRILPTILISFIQLVK